MFFDYISLEFHGQTDLVYLVGGKNLHGCAYDLCFPTISPGEDCSCYRICWPFHAGNGPDYTTDSVVQSRIFLSTG